QDSTSIPKPTATGIRPRNGRRYRRNRPRRAGRDPKIPAVLTLAIPTLGTALALGRGRALRRILALRNRPGIITGRQRRSGWNGYRPARRNRSRATDISIGCWTRA